MAIHRLSIEDFDEDDYALIAIHTSLEDYHLAYFINQKLPILLHKNPNDIQLTNKEGDVRFTRFTFEEAENGAYWNLLQNKAEIISTQSFSNKDLFTQNSTAVATRVYLLPEFKKVDYFLKIDNYSSSENEMVDALHHVDKISAIYTVNANQVKSKNNLIF